MISKGCHYNIVRVRDLDSNIPPIESLLIMSKFLEDFPNELPRIPLEREIDFGVDLIADTNPILIPSYWMARAESK